MATDKPTLPTIPSAAPPRIAGLASKPTLTTNPQPGAAPENKENNSSPDPSMTPTVVYPQPLANGDILLGLMERLPLHSARLIKRTDPSQKIPFLMDCKCGTQARVYSEDDLRKIAANHLALRAVRETPSF